MEEKLFLYAYSEDQTIKKWDVLTRMSGIKKNLLTSKELSIILSLLVSPSCSVVSDSLRPHGL